MIQARVLVVDDDQILRTQLKRLTKKFVTEVEVAADGVDGLEAWEKWCPDVVVTDIFMPRMNGLEMCSAIKSTDPDAQIIVITTDAENETLRRALDIGVDRYIIKPVDIHLLVDAIGKCLRDRR